MCENVRRTTTRHDKTLNNLIWQNDVLRNQNILVAHSFRFSFQGLTWKQHMSPTLCLINLKYLFINLCAVLFVFYLFYRWYLSIALYLSTAMSSDRMKGIHSKANWTHHSLNAHSFANASPTLGNILTKWNLLYSSDIVWETLI